MISQGAKSLGNLLLLVVGALLLVTSAQATTILPADSTFGLGSISMKPNNPSVQTANATGSHKIGVKLDYHVFAGRNMTLYWWYPATPAAGSASYVAMGGVKGQAVQNAPLDRSGGAYPVVIFSPGLGAVGDAYYFYVQNLASRGYIVVSIEHLDARRANITTNPAALLQAKADELQYNSNAAVELEYSGWFRSTQFALTYRPQEIEFALDTVVEAAATPSSPWFGALDTDNIGMSGHSLGGAYTMFVGGGMPIYCDYPLTLNELDVANPILTEVSPCAWPLRQAMPSAFELADPRIKAIIPLAAPFFIQDSQIVRSASKIRVPMMVITGDDLILESTRKPQRDASDNAADASYFVMVANTSHYLVGDSYQLNPKLSANLTVADRANFAEKAAVYMDYSAAFFDVYLKGNTSAKATLHRKNSPLVSTLAYHD